MAAGRLTNYTRYSKKKATKKAILKRVNSRVSPLVKKYVNKQIHKNIEVKSWMTQSTELTTFDTFNGPLFVQDMTSQSQGLGNQEHTGTKVKFIGFRCNGFMFNNSTTTPIWVRAMLIYTKDPSDIGLSSELFSTTAGATTSVTTLGNTMALQYADINKSKYSVLWKREYKLGPSTAENTKSATRLKFMKKVQLPITYEGATYGAGNQSARVHLVLIASEAPNDTGAGSIIELSYRAQSYFVDV